MYMQIVFTSGLLGTKGRSGHKIHIKQKEISNKINKIVKESMIKYQQEELIDVLKGMLDVNYKKRMSPVECLKHKYFQQVLLFYYYIEVSQINLYKLNYLFMYIFI